MKPTTHNGGRRPGRLLRFAFFAVLALLALGGAVMLLWNAVLPAIIVVPVIGYWQAVGLLLLCKILFGSFGPGGGSRQGRHRRFARPPAHLKAKFMKMSENEKATFKERWQKRCIHKEE